MLITGMYVGLTGQIGAGKSTAAEILESLGAVVIDADRLGRLVVDRSAPLRRKLARAFGADVITPGGTLDRRKVAERAFVDPQARRILNSLVHPYLLKELGREMRRLAKHHDMVVIDAALLLEWGLDSDMDATIVIEASQQKRFERLAKRGLSPEDAKARQKTQASASEFGSRATFVVENNDSIDQLGSRLKAVWEKLTAQNTSEGKE